MMKGEGERRAGLQGHRRAVLILGKKNVPEVTAVDFTAICRNGLTPAAEKYAQWLAGPDRQAVTDLRR